MTPNERFTVRAAVLSVADELLSSSMRRAIGLMILVGLTFASVSCDLFGHRSEPVEILVRGDSFTLRWDPPIGTTASSRYRVTGYELYYRPHSGNPGQLQWQALAEIAGPAPLTHRITREMLGPGKYDFAVRSVYDGGAVSDYHASTDYSADPPSGWYVTWIGGE